MARAQNLRLLEKAVPLSGAWVKFAPADRQAELERTSGFVETYVQQPVTDTLNGMVAAARASLSSWQTRNKLITDMRDWLLDELYNNQLVALGVRKLPSQGHYHVVIDPDYFDNADIDWEHSTLRWEDKLYTDVRVSDPRQISDGPEPRKGSIDAVDWAILELVKANKKFGSLPRQKACQLIREKLGRADIKGSGLSDQNLAKRIVFHCGKKAISK